MKFNIDHDRVVVSDSGWSEVISGVLIMLFGGLLAWLAVTGNMSSSQPSPAVDYWFLGIAALVCVTLSVIGLYGATHKRITLLRDGQSSVQHRRVLGGHWQIVDEFNLSDVRLVKLLSGIESRNGKPRIKSSLQLMFADRSLPVEVASEKRRRASIRLNNIPIPIRGASDPPLTEEGQQLATFIGVEFEQANAWREGIGHIVDQFKTGEDDDQNQPSSPDSGA